MSARTGINPFAKVGKIGDNAFLRTSRWCHLFDSFNFTYQGLRPNWKAQSKPASLPLTTERLPSALELQTEYLQYPYLLTIRQINKKISEVTLGTLEEMICQREAENFQVIESESISKDPPNLVTVHLTRHHEYHKLQFDKMNRQIQVVRYIHKLNVKSRGLSIPYRYFLWSPCLLSFLAVDRDICARDNSEFDWNVCDETICGMDVDFEKQETLNYSRLRLAVIPPARVLDSACDMIQGNTGQILRSQVGKPWSGREWEGEGGWDVGVLTSSALRSHHQSLNEESQTPLILNAPPGADITGKQTISATKPFKASSSTFLFFPFTL